MIFRLRPRLRTVRTVLAKQGGELDKRLTRRIKVLAMKTRFRNRQQRARTCSLARTLALVAFLVPVRGVAQGPKSDLSAAKPYLGRWDLTLKAPDREYPSWLELRIENGKLAAQMVGRWGNARPLPKVELSAGHLTLVSPKEEEGSKNDLVFDGELVGETLSGTLSAPDGGSWSWTGKRAPLLRRTKTPNWGKPIQLFNGKDLTEWKMDKPNTDKPWQVTDGTLVSPGHGPEIINDRKFQDFKLHIEFNCAANSNSGVYLRGRYEVQIEDNSIQEPPSHHTGGVYGFIAPASEIPRRAGEWQTFDITLVGRTITVVQNGKTIIDRQEIPGITGGALDSHEGLPGPIYLQGSEDGHVAYRNIVITPAKD
jgi:3-keto-disaccharide hydrolase